MKRRSLRMRRTIIQIILIRVMIMETMMMEEATVIIYFEDNCSVDSYYCLFIRWPCLLVIFSKKYLKFR
jgi:uncharacterized membrane protein YobD (UPF0266 family)